MRPYSRSGLFKRLSALALVIACAQPCAARIVYTPTHIVLHNTGTMPIDLNNDGTTDLTIQQSFTQPGCYLFYAAAELPRGTSVVSTTSGPDGFWASALNQGQTIGRVDSFVGSSAVLTDVYTLPYCPFPHGYGLWGNAGPHYLGISFTKNSHVRYAWVELDVSFTIWRPFPGITTTLMG